MSVATEKTVAPLVRPAESDTAFVNTIRYETPLHRASLWLRKLILKRLDEVELALAWYKNPTRQQPPILLSKKFDQDDHALCDRGRYYCDMIKEYDQCEAPAYILNADERLVNILVNKLKQCLKSNNKHIHLLRLHLKDFFAQVSGRCGKLPKDDYIEFINRSREHIFEAFGQIGYELSLVEASALSDPSDQPATKADLNAAKRDIKQHTSSELKSSTEKIEASVKTEGEATRKNTAEIKTAVDDLGKQKKRFRGNTNARFSPEDLELIYGFWLAGQKKLSIKGNCKHKVGFKEVFEYFRKELYALKVHNDDGFKKAIRSWRDHLNYMSRKNEK